MGRMEGERNVAIEKLATFGWTRSHMESDSEETPSSHLYKALYMLMNFYHMLIKYAYISTKAT